ncbi:MAG TPA: NAD(P)H-hydrate epimerase, partial [Novosphingobium sp.]|nr:NAD(P)H-hydrate epimerase [Novosphingobium sp.]
MPRPSDLILTAAHMRAAEEALIAAGTSVDELMQRAGQGAADWVWRISGGRAVTVLCGPGNNGGDGWVIAETLRQRGSDVAVVMAAEPATDAARTARALYKGQVLLPDAERHGEVLVDCLFGTGLTRPLSEDHLALMQRLAASHDKRIAVDLPSGVSSDDGALLSDGLPHNDLTIALGAWKHAHYVMPAAARMGALRRVDIGITPVRNDFTMPWVLRRPVLTPPAADANKYSRGMVGIVVGDMPGAALLAAKAAMASGAGYVKLLSDGQAVAAPADLVVDDRPLGQAVTDHRLDAILVGPGLGRDARAQQRLNTVLQSCQHIAVVLDADALHLYPHSEWSGPDSGTYDGSRHSLLSCFEMHSKAEPSRPQGLDPSDVALLRRQIVMTPHQGEL